MGCTNDDAHHASINKELIKGSWQCDLLTPYFSSGPESFTFRDSTCTIFYAWEEQANYWIERDTLFIHGSTGDDNVYKFLVDSLTTDDFVIKPITPETKNLLLNYSVSETESIHLTKIKSRFDWSFERIGFYCTGCFSACPEMYLEIDRHGHLFFYGNSFTEKEGYYSGTLSPGEFEFLKSQLNCIVLDSLQRDYTMDITDTQTRGVMIKTKDTVYESNVNEDGQAPIELNIFLYQLMGLYKRTELIADSTIAKKFEFEEFQTRGLLPAPPVPKRGIQFTAD